MRSSRRKHGDEAGPLVTRSTKARDLGLFMLASAIGAFVGLGMIKLIHALLSQAGYAPGEGGAPWLGIVVVTLCCRAAQRLVVRRFGINFDLTGRHRAPVEQEQPAGSAADAAWAQPWEISESSGGSWRGLRSGPVAT
jgi:hypothetical protein